MNSIKSTVFFLFSLGIFVNQAIAQVPSYVPSNGLVGWWPFTGNANDLSGNGNNGTVNGPTLTSDRFGNANQAYLNNTSSGSITLNSGVLDNLGAFNVGIWFNASNSQSGVSDIFQIDANSPCAIYPGQTANPNNNLYVRYDNGLAQFYFSIQINSTVVQYTVPSPPSTNNWHFVSVNYSGTSVSFFLNGQLLNTQPLSGTFLTFNQPLFIANWCTYEDFNGKIDDIGIWNRALTQQEITNLYNANNGPQATISTANNSICAGQSATLTASVANAGTSCNTTGFPPSLNNGLVGYWPFCGNANDASGNGNNGILNGATLTTDRFGAANQSYSFDGVNDNIRVNNNAIFSFLLNSSFTSNVWFKIQTLPNGTKFLISQGDGDAQHQNRLWGSYLTQNSVNNWFRGNNEPNQVFNTHPSLQVNAWKMVTMVREFNSTIKMYIDGQLVDTDVDIAGIASPFTQIRDIYFGALYDAYNAQLTAFLNGQLDDIGIWNRALSAQEVSQLYNAGQATYLWSNGANTASITVTPTQTTTYTCTITMNGATTTQTQTITVNPLPTVNAGQDQTVFAGTQVTLSGSGANSYSWNNGVSNNTPFAATNTTTYTVTGTTNGCSATDQVLVTVLPAPSIGINTNDTICNGTSTTITANVANAGTSCVAPGLSGTLTNGLVGYWPFCGNANDLSGNGNNGTVNGATLTTDRFGVANSAYSFDGVNDYIDLGSYILNQPQEYTIDLWAKFNNTTFSYLFSQATNGEIQLHLDGSGNVKSWNKLTNGSSVSVGSPIPDFSNWHHITAVFNNNTKILQFVIDGTMYSTTIPQGVNIQNFSGPALFGRQSNTNANFLSGKLDDIGIWNRALTAQEVSQLYNAGQPTYAWSNGATTPSITVTPTQTTTYTCIITMNGASTTQSQTITVNSLPTVNAGQDQTVFSGAQVTLSGTGANSYTWNNGVTNNTPFAATTTTTYTVAGTSNGCSATDQVLITVLPSPSISINTNDTICNGTTTVLNANYNGANLNTCLVTELPLNLQAGLLEYYPFCGNANNLINNSNNGVVNGCGLSQDALGNLNSSYSFNGINNSIVISNDFCNGQNLSTASFRVRFKVNANGSFGIWNKDGSWKETSIYVNSNGAFGIFWAYPNQYNAIETPNNVISPNTWYDAVIIFDGLNSKIFLNGTQVNGTTISVVSPAISFSSSGTCGVGINRFGFQKSSCNPQSYFNGILDEFMIYNRVLSNQEILQLNTLGQATYLWSNGATTPSITVTPTQTTTYTCTITMNGATTTQTQTITVNAIPTLSAGQNQAICAGTAVTLSGSGASTYAWSNNIQNGVPFTPLSTQTYTVTGTTTSGCVNTAQVTVSVNPLPTVNAGQAQTVCAGTAVTLSGSGASTYTWNNNIQNGISFTPLTTQTYTVTGTTTSGCVNTAQVTVSVNPLPTVNAGQAQTVCAGTAVTLSGSGASTYTWNNNIQNGVSFTPLLTQTYTVTGTAANGCQNTAQVTVSVNVPPAVSGGSTQTVCVGTPVTLNGSGASAYSWNNNVQNGVPFTPLSTQTYTVTGTAVNGCTNTAQVQVVVNALPAVSGGQNQSVCTGNTVTLNGSGAQSYTWNNNVQNGVAFTPSTTQLYTITGTDANGCQNTAQVQVTVNPLPTVSAGLPIAVCSGANVVLFGSGAQSYTWSNGIQNAIPFIPGSTQVYTVTGTDANGCTDTDQILVTVNSYPQVSAGQNQTVCAGDSVTLTASGAPSYSWSNGIVNGVSFVPASTTTYSVIGNSNGCLDTAQVTVIVNPLPTVSAGQAQTVCAGSSVTLNATGASTYLWDNNVQNSVAFVPNTTQLYTVTGTDINGCENTAQITVIVYTLPTVSGGQNQSVCAGATLVLNGAGALTYTWNNNIQNGVSFIPNATQTYTVIGTDTNGCQGTDQVLVEVLSPTVSEINEVACVEFTLNGQSYTQSGTYIQNLSNVAGCDSTLTLNLTINELPSIPVISSSNDNILSIDAQANVTYQWIFCNSGLFINNATDTIYSPTVNGVYGIELTNGCGTVSSECITINNMNVPELMNEILVYPNPSLGLVYIQGLTETAIPFKLQDVTGRAVLEGMLNSSSNVLDITRLSSGNYRLLISGYGIFSLVKK